MKPLFSWEEHRLSADILVLILRCSLVTYGNEKKWPCAPVGDTLNMANIKTEGTPDGQSGNPFNQTSMIIHTADKGIDQRIHDAAESAGYSNEIINTMVFPAPMLHMGLENYSDSLCVYIRPALYKDKQAGNDYLNTTPAVVLRVTPNETTGLDPYDVPKEKVRGTGTTEFDLMDDVEELRKSIHPTHPLTVVTTAGARSTGLEREPGAFFTRAAGLADVVTS